MNTEASHSSTGKSPTFDEFETLYARLREMKEEGEGDSFQADALRLRLDSLYDVMSDHERAAVRDFASREAKSEDEFNEGDDAGDMPDDLPPIPVVEKPRRKPKTPAAPKLKAPAKAPPAAKSALAAKVPSVKSTAARTAAAKPAPAAKSPPAKPARSSKPARPPVVPPVEAETSGTPDRGSRGESLDAMDAETSPFGRDEAPGEAVESRMDRVSRPKSSPPPHRDSTSQPDASIDAAAPSPAFSADSDEVPASALSVPDPAAPALSPADSAPATHAPLPKPAEIFDRSVTFETLGLRSSLLKAITAMGFEYPTDIQARLIPPALAGKDVIGQARTGTGKTAAFGLPILQQADKDLPMQALILVPTRELAAQVAAEMDEIGRFTPIRTSCIIGGESMRDQARSIAKGGHVMVGTPGRVMDMHQRGEIHFNNIRFIVLDEVDRMLDIGFREDIRKILKSVRTEHQTMFVSATISDEIERLGRSFMKPDAEKIVTISGSLTVSLVDQKYVSVEPWDKRAMLLFILRREKPETTVVFCRTKATVDKLAKYLADHGIEARPIHGDMPQNKRTKVMDSMRSGKLRVLIASDLAARGLDIDHITHVVNYDLPEDPEVYVHRIGRTARAGRRGFAWSFVTRDEGQRLTEIEMLCSTIIERMEYKDWVPGPVPDDIRVSKPRVTHRPESAMDLLAEKAAERSGPSPTEGLTAEQIKAMFPDGVIPKNLPKSTLGSKFRRRR
jgi:ATP-dependent RNA helicase DeaD